MRTKKYSSVGAFVASAALLVFAAGCSDDPSPAGQQNPSQSQNGDQGESWWKDRAAQSFDTAKAPQFPGGEPTGLNMDVQAGADTAKIEFLIKRVSCDGAPIVPFTFEKTVDLAGPNGIGHALHDEFVVLDPGCYDVLVSPLKIDGTPSEMCEPLGENSVVVIDGYTTELGFVEQCVGKDKGALDIYAIFNTPPNLEDGFYQPGKFVSHCASQTICVTFADPDGDPIELEWSQIGGVPLQSGPTAVANSHMYDPLTGVTTECATLDHAGPGLVSIEVKAFDLMQDVSGASIRVEDFLASHGFPGTSHDSMVLLSHGENAANCACVPHAEVCDKLDNDCDGTADEGISCACIPGNVKSCYGGPAGTAGVGVCKSGGNFCLPDGSGYSDECVGAALPSIETCNGLDDDCDGQTDEDFPAVCALAPTCSTVGEIRACNYGGPAGTAGVGECKAATQTCLSSFQWSACSGEVLPSSEVCNDKDDDCDGAPDEDLVGCNPLCSPEICNGIDDDCDGEYDEGCSTFQCTSPNRVWFFGSGAGLDFSGGAPVGVPSPSNTQEGCAVLSCGNKVRISTDGTTLYDSTNTAMPNGSGLLGESSATQAALLVPRPNSDEIFVFNVEQLETGAGPLHYSVVDMSQRNGLGDVDPAQKNVDLSPLVPVGEKMTSVKHANGVDTWILVHAYDTDEFMAYLVDAQGVSGPIVSAVGLVTHYGDAWGQLQASKDGTRLASTTSSGIELFHFDHATGVVSNPIVVSAPCMMYGVEFSPNGNVLYGNCYSPAGLHQYDISSNDQATINASDVLLGTAGGASGGSIQRGPDGKLYIAGYAASALSVIENPNELGPGAGFSANVLSTPGTIYHGLPNVFAGSY